MLSEFKLLEEIRAVSTQVMYLSRSVDSSNKQLNDLNEGLKNSIKSTNKSSFAMLVLTAALVFFAFAQVGVAWLNYKADKYVVEAKKICYQSALQTSDIDLNYRTCLRAKGLSD